MSTNSRIVSEFMTTTCNINLQPNYNKLLQWRYNAVDDYNTVAGSVSELHIDPMLPCVRDTDIMSTSLTALAVPSRRQVPLSLPSMFQDTVDVYKIIDAEFPGYVYLLKVGRLSKRLNTNTYEFEIMDTREYLQTATTTATDQRTHGPAILRQSEFLHFSGVLCIPCLQQAGVHQHSSAMPTDQQLHEEAADGLSKSADAFPCNCQDIDIVICVGCLAWPKQATDWPRRHRKYNWPDALAIDNVVNSGCDVVGVAHHQCRQNDWKRTHQWRLSFSRAETVLLNSWTPKQQIVYHILRFLLQDSPQIKLSDGKRHKTLSRYHLKTLMMWTCESKHSSWWQPENVVQLSAGLMRRLVIQYKSSNWKGYFVTASNLLECEVSLSVIGQLTAFTEVKYLTDWLIDNYIYKCAKQCLKDTNSDAKLLDVMSSLVEYKQFNSRLSSFINTGKAVVFISEVFSNPPSILDGKDAEKYYEELGQVDNRLQPLFIAMLCLKQINTDDIMSEQTINLLSAFLTKFDQKLRTTEEETSTKSMLHKAIRLMQISVEQSTVDYTSSAILFVLSFIYLRRTKKVDDGDGDVVRRLANVYLAVMYHLAGYYQAALRHCKRVITVHESTHVIDGFTLPKLDDDIDNILGLAVLYQYMRQHATIYLSSLPLNANAVSVQSFTYYLMFLVRLASVNRNDKLHNLLMKRYKFCLLQTSKMFSADFLLFYVATKKWQSADRDVRCIKTFNSLSLKCCAAELRRLLLLLSVEQMTVFRQGIFHDYQSVCNIATSDVEALYAHLCGQYEQCLQMSQKNVSCLWSQTNYFPIPIFGCMLHLMSDDVTSLAALSQLNHFDVTKIYATFHQLTLSLYLVVETKLKLSSPLTSLVKELHRVKELHCRLPTRRVCDRLLLLFIYRKALKKITGHSTNNCTSVNR